MNYADEAMELDTIENNRSVKAEAAKVSAPRAGLDLLDGFEPARNVKITLRAMNYKFVAPGKEVDGHKGRIPRFAFWANGKAVIDGVTVPVAINIDNVLLDDGFVVDEAGSSSGPGDLVVSVTEQVNGEYFRYMRRVPGKDGNFTYREVATKAELAALVEGRQFLRMELVSSPRFVSFKGKPATRVAREGAVLREDARLVMAKYFAARDAALSHGIKPDTAAKAAAEAVEADSEAAEATVEADIAAEIADEEAAFAE